MQNYHNLMSAKMPINQITLFFVSLRFAFNLFIDGNWRNSRWNESKPILPFIERLKLHISSAKQRLIRNSRSLTLAKVRRQHTKKKYEKKVHRNEKRKKNVEKKEEKWTQRMFRTQQHQQRNKIRKNRSFLFEKQEKRNKIKKNFIRRKRRKKNGCRCSVWTLIESVQRILRLTHAILM